MWASRRRAKTPNVAVNTRTRVARSATLYTRVRYASARAALSYCRRHHRRRRRRRRSYHRHTGYRAFVVAAANARKRSVPVVQLPRDTVFEWRSRNRRPTVIEKKKKNNLHDYSDRGRRRVCAYRFSKRRKKTNPSPHRRVASSTGGRPVSDSGNSRSGRVEHGRRLPGCGPRKVRQGEEKNAGNAVVKKEKKKQLPVRCTAAARHRRPSLCGVPAAVESLFVCCFFFTRRRFFPFRDLEPPYRRSGVF